MLDIEQFFIYAPALRNEMPVQEINALLATNGRHFGVVTEES